MKALKIAIETSDYTLPSEFKEQAQIPGGATITSSSHTIRRMQIDPHLIEVVIEVSASVATGVVANWLYDKLKGRASRVRINRQEIVLN